MNLFRQSSAAGERGERSGNGLDRRKRVIQLVPKDANEALPCLALFRAQDAAHIRDDEQLVRHAIFAKGGMAHGPAAMLAGKGGFHHLRRWRIEVILQSKLI